VKLGMEELISIIEDTIIGIGYVKPINLGKEFEALLKEGRT